MKIEDYLKTVPERLRQIEKALKLNKTNVSKKAGITRSAYSNIATGAQTPSADFIYKICFSHNISADWLLFGMGNMLRIENEFLLTIDSETKELYIQFIKNIEGMEYHCKDIF